MKQILVATGIILGVCAFIYGEDLHKLGYEITKKK